MGILWVVKNIQNGQKCTQHKETYIENKNQTMLKSKPKFDISRRIAPNTYNPTNQTGTC